MIWKKIASAPKDQTPVILYSKIVGVVVGKRLKPDSSVWFNAENPEYNIYNPTHWMQLPDPPTEE